MTKTLSCLGVFLTGDRILSDLPIPKGSAPQKLVFFEIGNPLKLVTTETGDF